MAGKLIICAGPIGNLGDAPPRLAEALGAADIVYAEDTRRTATLLQHLGVQARVRSYFVGNEQKRADEIAGHLESGATVAVITDAGVPGISDPGLTAVRAAIEGGSEVSVIPGASAVTAAIAVSGLSGDRFVFEGFLPRKGGARSERLDAIAAETRTVVFFAAPRRIARDLGDLAEVADSGREVVVCRELTKLHEEVWRGTLAEAVEVWSSRDRVRGEITIVVGGAADAPADIQSAVESVQALVDGGSSTRDAVRRIAKETGVSRRELYERVVD